MKYLKIFGLIIFLFLINLEKVEGVSYKKTEIATNTYIIGSHLFNREKVYDINGNQIYKGALSTDYIMLASKTINSKDLEDMVIYYKSLSGVWKNAITNQEINEKDLPNTFEINYVNSRYQEKYEAEEGILENNSVLQKFNNENGSISYSGLGFVGNFNEKINEESSLTFTINVPFDDMYDLIFSSCSKDEDKYDIIKVDDASEFKILKSQKSDTFQEFKNTTYLTKGEHKIKLISTSNNIYIDYLLIRGHSYSNNPGLITISPDSYTNTNLLTIITDKETIDFDNKKSWINKIEYNNSKEKGVSKLSYKVSKEFISNENTYYDISIDYYDEGDGYVLLQSSTDSLNKPNYSKDGYGGYPNESWWSWSRGFYSKNLAFGLTNTKKWKTHTFRVNSVFFEKNLDNYLHLYFGKEYETISNETIKINKITIKKRNFMIESIDKNNNEVVGNIYTNETFNFGFNITNTTNLKQEVKISYFIISEDSKVLIKENLGLKEIPSKDSLKFYVKKPDTYGAFKLLVKVESDSQVEEEIIDFSLIISDLSGENNDFLALNTHFGYSGWSNEEQISKSLKISKMLGVNSHRFGVNQSFITSDINSGYSSKVGRYSYIFDPLINKYKQDILINTWVVDSNVSVGSDGVIEEESFKDLKKRINELYSTIATLYGDSITYYEILNEWNYFSPYNAITAEMYAEIVIEVSKVIKNIDKDAQIVVFSSGDDVYANDDYSKYSTNSWMGKVLATKINFDYNDDGLDEVIGICDVIDVISIHPYTANSSSSPDGSFSFSFRVNEVRKLLENYTDKKIPIWFSEIGYQTSTNGISQIQQAAYTTRTLIWGLANSTLDKDYVKRIYLYSFQDEANFSAFGEANFGIVTNYKDTNIKPFTRDVEMSAKSSYVAVNMFSYLLNNAKLIDTNEKEVLETLKKQNSDDYYYWYKFQKDNNTIIALYNNNELIPSQKITLEVPFGNITIYDMYGNIIDSFENNDQSISLDINYKPIYIYVENK